MTERQDVENAWWRSGFPVIELILSSKKDIIELLKSPDAESKRIHGYLFYDNPEQCKMCAEGMILDMLSNKNAEISYSFQRSGNNRISFVNLVVDADELKLNYDLMNGCGIQDDLIPVLNIEKHEQAIIERKGREFWNRLCTLKGVAGSRFDKIKLYELNDSKDYYYNEDGEYKYSYSFSLADIADLIDICWPDSYSNSADKENKDGGTPHAAR